MDSRIFSFCQFRDFRKPLDDQFIIFRNVRHQASGAVLDAVFQIAEISTAALPEGVKRAVTEQTVEMLRVRSRMAGKELTFPVAEEFIMLRLF